jgi:hypothetical protein
MPFDTYPLWALLRLVEVDLKNAAQRLGVATACLSQWQSQKRRPLPSLWLFLTEIARAELEHKEEFLTLEKEEAERALNRKLPEDWRDIGRLQCEVGRKLLALQEQRNESLSSELRGDIAQWLQKTPLKKRLGSLHKDIEKFGKKYPTRRGTQTKKAQTENGAQAA